ncbi:MAG TPA: DUF4340 domain-containing protein [Thermoanaerobaculia bacterium]|nr:DUF4340 domain-containing protein [Thermoanaerobaculia bacterium]
MRPRTLLILLVLVLGLGTFIWFYERKLPSSEERTTEAKKVVPVKKDEVRKVALETPAGKVVFERVVQPKKDEKDRKDDEEAPAEPASEWKITAPMQARADAFAVDGLLDSLTGLEKTRTLDNADRKDVGLDKPRATVRLETEDGAKILQIGAEVPPGGSLIAGLEGEDKVYVVSDTIWSQINREPGSWRDRQLFRAGRDTIARIALTGPGGQKIVLAQQGDRFRIESPFADRADKNLVNDLYADLSGLTAEEFVDRPDLAPAAMGLQPPQGVVEVGFRQGQPLRIELGGPAAAASPPPEETDPTAPPPAPMLYARVGPQLIETRTRLTQTAARPPADWRARGLSGFEVYDVEAATVRDAKGSMRLTRAGTDWKRGEETISYVPVSDFLFALTGTEADRLLSPQEAGALGQPVLTVELDGKDLKEMLTLYPARADGAPARVSGRDSVLLLPKDKLQEILARMGDVRGAKPVTKEEGKTGG